MTSQDESSELRAELTLQEGVAVIALHGEIDAFAESRLVSIYTQAEEQDPRAVILDLAEVDYINSTGIALLVELLARARDSRRPLLTCSLSEHYREIFQITKLADFMAIHDDVESALGSLGTQMP
jgi:anti-anti-sigma factor